MKLRHLALPCLAFALASCDQGAKQEARRLAEERAALDREKAQLAADKAAAVQAANERERTRLESERVELEHEKARIAAARDAEAAAKRDAQFEAERTQRLAAEQKAAAEMAARQAAETREREAREAREAAEKAVQQARTQQTIALFYEALAPFGEWVQVERYGYAFRPDAAKNPGWRPYTDGGWVYTDVGWTWRSNEPFGWATYHYGRWARVPRLGWIWVPNSEWGPAWVAWRRSSDYIGWAPLPPDAWSKNGFDGSVDSSFNIGPGLYTFVRITDFGEPTYIGHCLEPERNVTIINNTTNITNVTYKTVQNRVAIVNDGPDFIAVNKTSRKKVPRLAIQRVAGAAESGKVEGGVLRIAAPQIESTPPSTKPKTVLEEVKVEEVDRGWNGPRPQDPKNPQVSKARPNTPPAPPAPRQGLQTGSLETRPLKKPRPQQLPTQPPSVPTETRPEPSNQPPTPRAAERPRPSSDTPQAGRPRGRGESAQPAEPPPQPERPEAPTKRFNRQETNDPAPSTPTIPAQEDRRGRPDRGPR